VLSQTPNGIRLHVIDIVLEELARVHSEAPMHLTEATFLDCLEPYFAMAQTGAGGDDVVQQRVVDKILVPFLDEYSVVSSSAVDAKGVEGTRPQDGDERKSTIFHQVHVGTVAQFIFDIASDGETQDRYRKSLYSVHKYYRKRLNKVGFDVELHDGDDDDDDNDGDADQLEKVHGEDHDIDSNENGDDDCRNLNTHKDGKKSGTSSKKDRSQAVILSKEEDSPARPQPKHVPEILTPNETSKTDDDGAMLLPDKEKDKEEIPAASSKRKRKKKKKKRKSEDASGESRPDEKQQEEEFTISVQDQRSAKRALKEIEVGASAEGVDERADKNKKKKKSKGPSPVDVDGRRVKFGTANGARSWKASMKGLRKKDPITPPDAAPEKGILRNKHEKIMKVKGMFRPRAVDYF